MIDGKRPQRATVRPTEGVRTGVERAGSANARGVGKRGRPKGSRNKPKGIVPTELANTMLLAMKDILPPEHYEYMRGVIRDGNAISTKRELDTLILLLSRNLYPALVMESLGDSTIEDEDEDFFNDGPEEESERKPQSEKKLKMPVFRKDVTERLKVLQSLLAMKEKSERAEDEARHEKPILQIFGRSGVDAGRLRLLIGVESGTVVGDADSTGREPDEVRTVSDTIPERQELLPPSEQG